MVTAPALRRPLLALVTVLALTTAACSASGGGGSAAPTTRADGPTTTAAPGTTTTSEGGDDDPTTTTTEGTDVEPTVAPKAGECWTPLTGEDLEAVSFVGDRVDCKEEHGGTTVAVIELGSAQSDRITPEVLDGDPSDPDVSSPLQSLASPACDPAWSAVLDPLALDPAGTILNSAERATKLHRTFWLPTGDEWKAGARWLRCDLQTTDGSTFTSPVAVLQTKRVPADLVPCFATSNGPGRAVACSSSAARWQVIANFSIKGAAGPKETVAYRKLLEQTLPPLCNKLTAQAVGKVGPRLYRIFTQSTYADSTGDFTCAAQVQGPLTKPFGT